MLVTVLPAVLASTVSVNGPHPTTVHARTCKHINTYCTLYTGRYINSTQSTDITGHRQYMKVCNIPIIEEDPSIEHAYICMYMYSNVSLHTCTCK